MLPFSLLAMSVPTVAQIEPPTLLFPPNNTQFQTPNETFSVTLSWSEVTGADRYQINGQFRTSGAVVPLIVSSTRPEYTLPFTPGQIPSEMQVLWAVQSIGESGTSAPSEFFRFTLGENGIPVPGFEAVTPPQPRIELVQPPDGFVIPEELLLFAVDFRWDAIEDAETYEFLLFEDNRTIRRTPALAPFVRLSLGFVPSVVKTYQWQVLAKDSTGGTVASSPRRSFTVGGSGLFPTPTPFPQGADHDQSGMIDSRDLFFFSMRYQTNDPRVDYDQSGLNDARDILIFVQRFLQSE